VFRKHFFNANTFLSEYTAWIDFEQGKKVYTWECFSEDFVTLQLSAVNIKSKKTDEQLQYFYICEEIRFREFLPFSDFV